MPKQSRKADPRKKRSEKVRVLLKSIERLGLKPEQIAEKINVSARSIYRWRNEGIVPTPVLVNLLEIFLAELREQRKKEQSNKDLNSHSAGATAPSHS